MKAITLWQPWASLLACGVKQYETRSWATKYRGPILIHSAKKQIDVNKLGLNRDFVEATSTALCWKGNFKDYKDVPFGCIIATAELVNCWDIVYNPGTDIDVAKNIEIGAELDVPRKHPDFHKYIVPTEQEIIFGDWTPSRYAWEFKNMKMLDEPILAKGKQRIWNWESEI